MKRDACLVASRQGLYLATRDEWRLLAQGAYFGVACVASEGFAFRHDPRSGEPGPRSGRVMHYRWQSGALRELGIVANGLDFSDNAFFLVDTMNQQILEFDSGWTLTAAHRILPAAERGEPGHAHINSIAGTADSVCLMLHNKDRGLPSEIVELDRHFRERSRIALPCNGCHDIVPLADGRLLTRLSPRGEIAILPGETHPIDGLWTRGLVAASDEIVVGSSLYGRRVARAPARLSDVPRSRRLSSDGPPLSARRAHPDQGRPAGRLKRGRCGGSGRRLHQAENRFNFLSREGAWRH